LNAHFGRLIDTISSHGGDIIKFAGDALLAIWPSGEGDLADAVGAALRCGLAAQASFRDPDAVDSLQLSLRIAIGAGPVSLLLLGGLKGRWEIVATGEALRQLGATSHVPSPGQVAISAHALALIGPLLQAKTMSVKPADGGAGILESVTVGHTPAPKSARFQILHSGTGLLGFIPAAVVAHLEGGSTEWLGESRRVSVLFTHFPGLNHATPVDRAQRVMAILQDVMDKYEGSINKISVDDKGAAMVAAFGLPPLALEDDASRALQAALAIRRKLGELSVRHSTGVTTGRVFCGVIGNSARREYTMIGDVVNLSARLMQAAAGGILCDDATQTAARNDITFEPLAPILVKGKASPISVFRPLTPSVVRATRSKTLIVGRESERVAIGTRLDTLSRDGAGGVIVIEGDAGIGKSRLVDDLVERAGGTGIPLLRGSALHVERSTPYFAWREVFSRLCGLQGMEDPEIRRRKVSVLLADDPFRSSLLPLANPVLGTDFSETEVTASLPAPAKPALTRNLLSQLLSLLPAHDTPKIVILEDCHWADSASLALAIEAVKKVPKLLLIVVSRPFPGATPDEYTALINAPHALVLRLQGLSPEDVVQLAALRLGVTGLPEPIAAIIRDKADGNPLFSEELAYLLRDTGIIEISGGECRISGSAGDLQNVDIPENVQAAMTSRIDRLPTSQQLALKSASVIGRAFAVNMLEDIYPIAAELPHLGVIVEHLEGVGMVRPQPEEHNVAWAFRHVTLQRVAYYLMLPSQRLQLHKSVVRWLEKAHADDRSSVYALLAYHCCKVVEYGDRASASIVKAIGYLKDAADLALRSAANRDAITFIREGLRFTAMLQEAEERDRLELSLHALLGPPLLETAGFSAPETLDAFTRAWDLCRKLGTAPEKFPVLYGLWNVYVVGSRLREALELARELEGMAAESDNLVTLLMVQRAIAETLHWTGRPREALEHIEIVLHTYKPEHNKIPEMRRGVNPAAVCCGFMAWTLWMLGYPDQAVEAVARGLEIAIALAHPFNSALAKMNAAFTYQFRGEALRTLQISDALLREAEEHGFVMWQAGAKIMRGWALCELGQMDAGLVESKRGFAQWDSAGADLVGPYYLSLIATVYLKAGDPQSGMALIDDALARTERTGEMWWRSDVLRLKGDLARALGMSGREHYLQALDAARRNGSRSLELRASMSLCRLLEEDGQTHQARASLSHILSQFNEGFETADLRAARVLLKQLA